jgi:hypothetical protein
MPGGCCRTPAGSDGKEKRFVVQMKRIMVGAPVVLLLTLAGAARSQNISGEWCAEANPNDCVDLSQSPASADVLSAQLSSSRRVYAHATGYFRGGRTALAFRSLESTELGFLTMLIRDASNADVRTYNADGSLRWQGPYRRKNVSAVAPLTPTGIRAVGSTSQLPASPTASISLAGRWNWTCCKGASSGSFTVSEHGADGRIRGVFGSSASDGASPFEGTFSNGQLVFTRFITVNGARQQQVWRAQVIGSGSSLRTTNGQWSGFGAVTGYTDFQATFVGPR